MRTLEQARKYFEGDIYAVDTGIVIEEVGEYYAKCSLKIERRHRNANMQVMGGAIFTLADFTFAVAANQMEILTVTTNSNISFVSTCKGDTLFAETKLIKNSRSLIYMEVSVTDNTGNLVAVVNSSGMHINK